MPRRLDPCCRAVCPHLPKVTAVTESIWLPPIAKDPHDPEILIRATLRMLIPTRKRKEALAILGSMIERIRLEEGCISCRLYQEVRKERALMFEELWAGDTGLRRHLCSATFRNILLVVEMATEAPEIRFDRISHSTGLDTIAQARGQLDPHSGASVRQVL